MKYDRDSCATEATLGYDVVGVERETGLTTRYGSYSSPGTAKETRNILAASENLLHMDFKVYRTI